MSRCSMPMGGDCACRRPLGHTGFHECTCELYGATHGVRVERTPSLFGGVVSKKART